jgi:hypothetical protein
MHFCLAVVPFLPMAQLAGHPTKLSCCLCTNSVYGIKIYMVESFRNVKNAILFIAVMRMMVAQ